MFGINLNELRKQMQQYLFEADKTVAELERLCDNPEMLQNVQKLRRIIDNLKSMASKYGVRI